MADQTVQQRPRMTDQFTLRMLGDNVTLIRSAWLELADELREDSGLRGRILDLLDGEPDRATGEAVSR